MEFLLGEGALLRKWHLVNWNQVCLSKEKGGLDMRKLNLMNKAFLGKWISRFSMEEEAAWRNCVRVTYGIAKKGGSPNTLAVVIGLVFGKIFPRSLISLSKIVDSDWAMVT